MGFVRGQKVTSLLNAPLKDPIKYKIMDYEVSLRRSEARMIEIEPYSGYHAHHLNESISIESSRQAVFAILSFAIFATNIAHSIPIGTPIIIAPSVPYTDVRIKGKMP